MKSRQEGSANIRASLRSSDFSGMKLPWMNFWENDCREMHVGKGWKTRVEAQHPPRGLFLLMNPTILAFYPMSTPCKAFFGK
jgi:hypothetical protein